METAHSPNPFSVQTPEEISASDAVSLFVDVFTDFPRIPHAEHTFIHGPRGSGKSMMFRYLQPDCQCLAKSQQLKELGFYGVYAPVKNTSLALTELKRLKDLYADVVLNEHFMVSFLASRVFESFSHIQLPSDQESREETIKFAGEFLKLLGLTGWKAEVPNIPHNSIEDVFKYLEGITSDVYRSVIFYLKRCNPPEPPPYTGPLCGYLDFLHPSLRLLKQLSFMPKGPIFLLIDDADNLHQTQTLILNSWVSTRTSKDISLKISTQLNYKTYQTVGGQRIDTPHDYTEVNISTVYTASKDKYKQRVQEIVKKRLLQAKIAVEPIDFFPPDIEQEKEVLALGEKIRSEWETSGRGYRPSDDVTRYARPTYIAELKGVRKAGSSYSYAGFDQLVHLSSGLIRHFLDPAAQMFAKQQSESPDAPVKFVSATIQNEVVRREADNLLFDGLEKLAAEEGQEDSYYGRVRQLSNLVKALGSTFHRILISNRSERRVFSIAISDIPDRDVLSVLKLGIDNGYFHVSSIGNKDGTGRTRLYILTRRLAPAFLLDPSSFAGYLFVTSQFLREAMANPNVMRKIKDSGLDDYFNNQQMSLFEKADYGN